MTALNEAIALIEQGRAEQGVEQLRTIASQGDRQALFVLANLTWSGDFVKQEPTRARTMFEYAAALGHTESNLLMTNLLASGVAGKRDWEVALERLQVEAAKIPQRKAAADLLAAMELHSNGDPSSVPEPDQLSQEPDARLFRSLLTATECAYLVYAAGEAFQPSMVFDKNGKLIRDTIRTSDGATFHWLIEDPAIHALNRRIAAATKTRYPQGEALQALRYSPGQQYHPHFDYIAGAENQRLWTALIYLNDDYEGGETEFVKTGLKVRGSTGDVLLFRNVQADGSPDPLAQHAGLPVTAGTKFLATRWIREHRYIP